MVLIVSEEITVWLSIDSDVRDSFHYLRVLKSKKNLTYFPQCFALSQMVRLTWLAAELWKNFSGQDAVFEYNRPLVLVYFVRSDKSGGGGVF